MRRFIDKVLNKAYTVTNKQLMLKHGVMCSVIYGELVSKYQYYKDRGQLTEDGFFYCTLEDLKTSLGISRTTQATEIKKLSNLGLIETKLCGIPAKRFIKVVEDSDIIDEFLGQSIAEGSRVDNACEIKSKDVSNALPSQQTSFQDDNKQVSRMTTSNIPRRQQTRFQGDNNK